MYTGNVAVIFFGIFSASKQILKQVERKREMALGAAIQAGIMELYFSPKKGQKGKPLILGPTKINPFVSIVSIQILQWWVWHFSFFKWSIFASFNNLNVSLCQRFDIQDSEAGNRGSKLSKT